jgi:hypothetical protein
MEKQIQSQFFPRSTSQSDQAFFRRLAGEGFGFLMLLHLLITRVN